MTAKCIMIQGTGSSVGKSRLVTGLCRIFAQDGYRVAPFKSQNMALNSYITEDGLEMGRAQVAQAEAAGVKPSVLMAPVLLKPSTDKNSQVIVMGKPWGEYSAMDYHQDKIKLLNIVKQAYDELAKDTDIIVIEGAGSPAEINLRERDIVNMGMAELVDAPVLLAGDIDKGGVFASLVGTMMLFTEDERARVKGTIINKFRGDVELLKPGLKMLEDIIKRPTLGVVPYSDIYIDEEDSPLEEMHRLKEKLSKCDKSDTIEVKILGLSRIVNFTDFVPLGEMAAVNLSYVPKGQPIGEADLVIIPSTTNVAEDMETVNSSSWGREILALAEAGRAVLGVGGGYRILGKTILGEGASITGLGLLDIETGVESRPPARISGKVADDLPGLSQILRGVHLEGYVIHQVKTLSDENAMPFAVMKTTSGEQIPGGIISREGNVIGTDLHGLFDTPEFVSKYIHYLRQLNVGREMAYTSLTEKSIDINAFRQTQYDRWADIVRHSLDMNEIYKILAM